MNVSHTTDNFTSRAVLFSGIEVKPEWRPEGGRATNGYLDGGEFAEEDGVGKESFFWNSCIGKQTCI